MQIINKREDWTIFEDTEDTAVLHDQAQDLFIRAIQNVSDGATASKRGISASASIQPVAFIRSYTAVSFVIHSSSRYTVGAKKS